MKISKIRTLWIIFLSAMFTANTCIRAVFMRLTGKITRSWVDNAIRHWIGHLLNVVHVRCKVVNPDKVEPVAGKATIIMCNHASMYDIPLSFRAFPNHSIRMLAKKELFKVPVLGKGMQAAEFPFINRNNRSQAMKDLEFARQLMESGIVIWIAPEGTRSTTGKMAPFKKGAFITAIEAKANIIPMGIRGAFDILPPHTMQFNLFQTAEIHIGQIIDAGEYTQENRDQLIERVFGAIRELAGD